LTEAQQPLKQEKVMNRQSATNQAWGKWMAAAAIGAATVYLMDPDMGRRRRALARDKMRHRMNESRNAIGVTASDLNNRLQGLMAEASRRLLGTRVVGDDRLLAERVRARLGHAVSHPHAIKVDAHQGRITLSGPILAHEKAMLLDVVRDVPGVADVEDRLEEHQQPDIPSLQGGGRRRSGALPVLLRENWPPALRAAAVLGGGMLAYQGLKGRSSGSAVFSVLGIGLAARGILNMPFRSMLGMDTERLPLHLEKSIFIDASPETVFTIWSNYEYFPHFMSHVQKVHDLGNGRSHWVVSGPAGTVLEWDATLTAFEPPRLMAWKSEPDSIVQHEGEVRFEPENDGTRVHVRMSYNPPAGVIGNAIASLFNGDPKKQMDEDLLRMKTFLERGVPPHDAAKPIVSRTSSVLH
jgi:uncharacterized membrane protein